MKKCVTSCKVNRDLTSTTTLKAKTGQDVRSLRSELSTLEESYAYLQDKLDALSHSTSRMLATQARRDPRIARRIDRTQRRGPASTISTRRPGGCAARGDLLRLRSGHLMGQVDRAKEQHVRELEARESTRRRCARSKRARN
jgi:hypothetical protein